MIIKNEIIRIWVNRFFAFLAGGLLLFIIMQFTVMSVAEGQKKELKMELDEIKYEPGRLLGEAKLYFEKNDYNNAKRKLNTLFEKHPISEEATEGKTLYTKVEKKQEEMDKKWDAAVTKIREEWAKKMAVQLKEQFEKDREQLEKDMNYNLDREWEKMKNKIREEWEMQK